jgi:Domain of unknown function (DUF1707)
MRAGDSDRQAVADKLKQALDEGRLDLMEYDERLQRTYAAKTYGDLDGVLDDLPAGAVAPRPAADPKPARAPVPEQSTGPGGDLVRSVPGGFAGVFVICTVIWGATSIGSGELLYFWPVWLLIPLAISALNWLGGRRSR